MIVMASGVPQYGGFERGKSATMTSERESCDHRNEGSEVGVKEQVEHAREFVSKLFDEKLGEWDEVLTRPENFGKYVVHGKLVPLTEEQDAIVAYAFTRLQAMSDIKNSGILGSNRINRDAADELYNACKEEVQWVVAQSTLVKGHPDRERALSPAARAMIMSGREVWEQFLVQRTLH